ncbi:TOBE domain-containing protein [Helicobacter cinaedi]|uniref:TOBE domain-containing protein n=1 Tax=Helicobacter cinaedi TaxID=213 RepID=UPI0003454921|nr:TOBE domain-containing protein [Helicobacter cinaedi]
MAEKLDNGGFISLKKEYTMKISARNQLKGKVVSIQKGSVNAIVEIDIGGGNVITSTISLESLQALQLEVGKEAYAIIKATSVMVGVE